MEIMIFDSLDTVQGYEGAPIGESKGFYQQHLAKTLGMSVGDLIAKVPYDEQLELAGEEIRKGNLVSVMLDGADEVIDMVKHYGVRPVIVTADNPGPVKFASAPLVEGGYIAEEDVFAINPLGSKKKAKTWKEAQLVHYPDAEIRGVFEDTAANLACALEAYNVQGYHVQQTDSGLTTVSRDVIRGPLRALQGELERRLR